MTPTSILYRVGTESSPNFDKLRLYDIPVVNGVVKPSGIGGISLFSEKDSSWDNSRTWILDQSSGGGLPAELSINNVKSQWFIEPAHEMPHAVFKKALESLNKSAVRYNTISHHEVDNKASFSTLNLPDLSTNPSKHVRFVYMALLAVARERIPVADWDDNDYADIAHIAKCLDSGPEEKELSALEYHPGQVLTKHLALVALAVAAYIKQQDADCQRANDEDMEADWLNDRALLRNALSLDNLKNHSILGEVVGAL
ncbi:hypothetical protein C8Q75DRAFT_369692 [Abortiporus biennis]|nr:hypothetical protein C8Q75DRAFT_369692 [Abortiporus biennis]